MACKVWSLFKQAVIRQLEPLIVFLVLTWGWKFLHIFIHLCLWEIWFSWRVCSILFSKFCSTFSFQSFHTSTIIWDLFSMSWWIFTKLHWSWCHVHTFMTDSTVCFALFLRYPLWLLLNSYLINIYLLCKETDLSISLGKPAKFLLHIVIAISSKLFRKLQEVNVFRKLTKTWQNHFSKIQSLLVSKLTFFLLPYAFYFPYPAQF